jgi:hypothetical protein
MHDRFSKDVQHRENRLMNPSVSLATLRRRLFTSFFTPGCQAAAPPTYRDTSVKPAASSLWAAFSEESHCSLAQYTTIGLSLPPAACSTRATKSPLFPMER